MLAGCQSVPEQSELNKAVVKEYMAEEIIVRKGTDYSTGGGTFTADERAFLADQFIDAVRDQLSDELRFSLTGQKPARVIIDMNTVNIATGAGRELSGESSFIRSNITIIDQQTGQTIAKSFIGASDEGARNNSYVGNVPVGAIASFIENRNSAAGSTRIIRARDAYLIELRKWFNLG